MRVLGIDFGTSNTVAMLSTPDGRNRPLLFDGIPVLPSAVYLDNDGAMIAGHDALRASRIDPSRFEPHPKRHLDEGTVLLGGQDVPVVALVAAVLTRVLAEHQRVAGSAPEQICLTHPVDWGSHRRDTLAAAVDLAHTATAGGGPAVDPAAGILHVPEPVAAGAYYAASSQAPLPVGATLAVYDLGAGTFDAAVVERTPHGFTVRSAGGIDDLGGVDFDHAIVSHLFKIYNPQPYSVSGATAWDRLIRPEDPAARRDRQQLYDDVRGAKETLSRTAHADIHLPAVDIGAHLTRDELDTLIRPHLERTVTLLRDVIRDAGLTPDELAGVFLVGGSSRIPLAAHLIHRTLGIAPTILEQPETVVAEGGLWLARPTASPMLGNAFTSGIPTVAHPPPSPVDAAAPLSAWPSPAWPSYVDSPAADAAFVAQLVPVTAAPPRPWYTEPMAIATLAVLALVVVAATVLLSLTL